MPACEGRPDGPCPDKRCDRTVHLSQGDLLLCEACEKFRFPTIATKDRRPAVTNTSRKVTDSQSSKSNVENASVGAPSVDRGRNSCADRSKDPMLSDATASQFAASGLQMTINELLSYVAFYRNKSNVDDMRRTVLSFYTPNDISHSKKLLIGNFSSQLQDCQFVSERRNSATRAAHEAEIDDIVNIIDILDLHGVFDGHKFVACNLDNLPKFGPEELNIAAVVDRQVRVEASIKDISSKVHQLASTQITAESVATDGSAQLIIQSMVTDMQHKLDAFSQSVSARLDHLNTVCSNSLKTANSDQQHEARQSDDADRKLNIVMFGVKEDRDVNVWHNSVQDVLRFVSGRDVDVIDMFRLGRFVGNSDGSPRKPRPILVKLRVFWDRRVILSKCSVLKQYKQAGVFIVPDEPAEVRRKNTFDRLQYRAQREGKKVVVIDGVLSIDDVEVFSLQTGYLHSVGHG